MQSQSPSPQQPSEAVYNAERLEMLDLSTLLDTPPEEIFDRYTELASRCLGVPVSLVSLVTHERQFFKSQIGLPEPWASQRETPLTHSFCQHVVATGEPLIVDNAPLHPLVKDNLAISEIGVMAYAGIPLQALGRYNLGAFCAIDTKPHDWSKQDIDILSALAEAVTREIDLRFVARQLHSQFEELQKLEVLRDDMVQMLVHDLRTPLATLVGGIQTLESMMDPDPIQSELLTISLRGGRTLAQMVDTILDVSRGEAGELALNRQEISPLALIDSALLQVELLSQRKEQELAFKLMPHLPPLFADEEKLSRVLVNLLGNATRHTPREGKIEIRVSSYDDETGKGLLWCVADDGSGIANEDFGRIFEKFGQVGASDTRKSTSGLGLAFCKMVVESHGGRIWVESVLGEGSQFFFTVPSLA
ncbi:HAMP domain-containing histidine kinase [bacterium]|nr:MAG: HAMP domain-containing histidine kinase [bacterium]